MIRPYLSADHTACLSLFESNVPHFFSEADRSDYLAFLDDADAGRELYFVLEREGELLVCGGVGKSGGECFLTYGMVRGDLHGAGLGSELTRFRLAWLRQYWPEVRQVRIDTSQHTEGFYVRFGFVVVERVKDGFGPGLDQVKMVAELSNAWTFLHAKQIDLGCLDGAVGRLRSCEFAAVSGRTDDHSQAVGFRNVSKSNDISGGDPFRHFVWPGVPSFSTAR